MNLIEQLKQTPKWNEFEKWWYDNYFQKISIGYFDSEQIYLYFESWCNFPFEMQSDVFRKFIERDYKFAKSFEGVYIIRFFKTFENYEWLNEITFNTLEELILWYFNN